MSKASKRKSLLKLYQSAYRELEWTFAIHDPILDDSGDLVDIRLIWSNSAFANTRKSPPKIGELGSSVRVRFDELLPFLNEAYAGAPSTQVFAFLPQDIAAAESSVYKQVLIETDQVLTQPLTITTTYRYEKESGFLIEFGDNHTARIANASELELQARALQQREIEFSKALGDTEAKLRERARFTLELHDNVLQDIAILGMSLNTMGELKPEHKSALIESLSSISKSIRQIIKAEEGDEAFLGGLGMRDIVQLVQELRKAIPTKIEATSAADQRLLSELPVGTVHAILAVVKESVMNAHKHADATLIKVHANTGETPLLGVHLTVTIIDDGKGLPPQPVGQEIQNLRRFSGQANLKLRCENLGGTLTINGHGQHRATAPDGTYIEPPSTVSAPGTQVVMTIPVTPFTSSEAM